MIKIDNTEVIGWEPAIRSMRNPKNSWDRSDSYHNYHEMVDGEDDICDYVLGANDLKLATTLANAGTEHGKFLRMINVYVDITAPLYWISEHDTYKIGTVRNSCSFMHKGVSKPFQITDFSVYDDRIYEILSPLTSKEYKIKFPYETDEFKIYTTELGRHYKIFKNGKVVSMPFTYTDNYGSGRTRKFEERELSYYQRKDGYFYVHLGGRNDLEKWQLHRLIAYMWIDNPNNLETVNHIDGDKGNNCVENLEWVSLAENIKKGYDCGLYDNVKSLHCSYIKWKNGFSNVDPLTKSYIRSLKGKVSRDELCKIYNLTYKQLNMLLDGKTCEYNDLFISCYMWEKTIDELNRLRDNYLQTNDDTIFFAIRQLLPQGYNVRYTWSCNYAVLRNIYHQRRDHRLPEWHTFCDWIETLPYAKELIIGETAND